ncbi:hypothetical protein VNO78_19917 [Psophocarpus tetragonolobus]|uniref:Uncharacterized protein n=1 Tax=Psophocarpus tetragonolobus TaxID=3891 RepID=A0AAN9S9H0_PSOTE
MRRCHEKDSKNADPPPGGGYAIEDVPPSISSHIIYVCRPNTAYIWTLHSQPLQLPGLAHITASNADQIPLLAFSDSLDFLKEVQSSSAKNQDYPI